MKDLPVLVLGAGAWGTALAVVLASNGHRVRLWARDRTHVQQMQQRNSNHRYLPGVPFPTALQAVEELDPSHCQSLILAIPCSALRDMLEQLKDTGARNLADIPLCLACKGMEAGSRLLPHEIAADILGDKVKVAVLGGPSFAIEVAQGLPTAVTIASTDNDLAAYFGDRLCNARLVVYLQQDVIGTQIGGAVKNIIAIAAGIADGLNLGYNARAAIITRGLAELTRLGTALGGKPETFAGLSGVGDLTLTCTADKSRNYRFGRALAQGHNQDAARAAIAQVVEGDNTIHAVLELARQHEISMPITEHTGRVINGSLSPRQAAQALLDRLPKPEAG